MAVLSNFVLESRNRDGEPILKQAPAGKEPEGLVNRDEYRRGEGGREERTSDGAREELSGRERMMCNMMRRQHARIVSAALTWATAAVYD
jgi:hypothetical protein